MRTRHTAKAEEKRLAVKAAAADARSRTQGSAASKAARDQPRGVREERQALSQPSREVYVGFDYELAGLFGEQEEATSPAAAPAAALSASHAQAAVGGSGDALTLRLFEELRAAQQEAQAARQEAQAAKLETQAAKHEAQKAFDKAMEIVDRDVRGGAEAELDRQLQQVECARQIIDMMRDVLGEAYTQLDETLQVAMRLPDECIRLGAAADGDVEQQYPPGWGRRLLLKRLTESRVTMNDIMVYHDMSRETMQELYDRSQDDVRGSFADSHPL